MKKNSTILLRILFISFFAINLITAGTTGKIAGLLTEKSTGNPLVGVNVVIEGTFMGASSDQDGSYIILNVPPGEYSLSIIMIGYKQITAKDVRVRIDQTTRLDFELEEETLESEAVVIIAQRELVQKDVSTSVTNINTEEIETLPVTTIIEAVTIQAGVENNFSVRGAGAEEILYEVDGIRMRDPRTNLPIVSLPLSSVDEISLERGGFNAEYGQVRSGIVKVITKDGNANRYTASLNYHFSPPSRKHFGISPYNPNSFWLKPFLDPDVAYIGTNNGAWNEWKQSQYPEFEGWNAISQTLLSDDNPDNDLSPEGAKRLFEWQHRKQEIRDQYDYVIDGGFGGPVPFISKPLGDLRFFTSFRNERTMLLIPLTRDDYKDFIWTLKLTSDISESMKLEVLSSLGENHNIAVNGTEQINSTDYISSPYQIANQINQRSNSNARVFLDSYYSESKVDHFSTAIKLIHSLSSKMFYESSIEFLKRNYRTGPTRNRDQQKKYEIVPGFFVDEAPFGWSFDPETGIADGMQFGGHTSTARDFSTASTLRFKSDFSYQINSKNLLKAGFEFDYDDLSFDYGIVNVFFPESNTWNKSTENPVRAGLYIQDKLEMNGWIANIGLRMDYNDANTSWVDANRFSKFYSNNYDPNEEYPSKKSESHFYFSPRLAISHPITENSKLYFNYGHFNQLPSSEDLYQFARGSGQVFKTLGDPDIQPERTIAYELGYDHSLYNSYLVQLAGFYRDITNQKAYVNAFGSGITGTVDYNFLTNNSYEDIRGFELTIKKLKVDWWSGLLTYTYQVNSLGGFGTPQLYENPIKQDSHEADTEKLYQTKPLPQPRANLLLSFHSPNEFGPDVFGFSPLEKWNINFISRYRAGNYLTYAPGNPEVRNNLQIVDNFNSDLRISKTFSIGDIADVTLFADIFNLFNHKTLSFVGFENAEDFNTYAESLHLPKSRYYDNIVGDDQPGDYRKAGVAFQPIEKVGTFSLAESKAGVIYYERSTGIYFDHLGVQVPKGRMDKIKEDKAYIDMPNLTSFNFLNPRQIFFGIKTSFHF